MNGIGEYIRGIGDSIIDGISDSIPEVDMEFGIVRANRSVNGGVEQGSASNSLPFRVNFTYGDVLLMALLIFITVVLAVIAANYLSKIIKI